MAVFINSTTSLKNQSIFDGNITCDSEFLGQYANYSLVAQAGLIALISIFVTIATSCVQKRRRLRRCCYGYPGLPSPMDFLVTPRYRWIYMALFFVMAASLINTAGSLNFTISNLYLNILYKTIILPVAVITIMTIQFFPLFACVESAPFPICAVTHFLGFIYSFFWLGGVMSYEANTYLEYIHCNLDGIAPSGVLVGAAIAEDVPLFLTGVYILLWYLYHFVEDMAKACLEYNKVDIDKVEWVNKLRQRLKIKKPVEKDDFLSDVPFYHVQHVRCILAKPLPQKQYGKVKGLFVKAFKHFFPYNKYDRLPLPYLGSVAAIIMLIYQLSIRILSLGAFLIDRFSVSYSEWIQPSLNLTGSTDAVLRTVVVGFPIVIIVSPFVSTLLVLVLLVHMTGAVSKDIKRVAKYGLSEKPPSTLSIVPGMWKYIGIQIGYAVSAWAIYTVIALVLGMAIALLYISLVVFTDWVIGIAISLIVPFLFPKLIFYVQFLICRFVFFEDRQGKFISITNRRLFNWFAFILFFYNGIAGLFGALLRSLMATFFGLLLLFRLDRIVLMKGFEAYDFGHKKYLGFLFLYSAYNNAILHVFVSLLKNSVATDLERSKVKPGANTVALGEVSSSDDKQYQSDNDCDIGVEVIPLQSRAKNRRACSRWLLAYTLLRNPSLASCRRPCQLSQASEAPDSTTTPTLVVSEREDCSVNDEEFREEQLNSRHSSVENDREQSISETPLRDDAEGVASFVAAAVLDRDDGAPTEPEVNGLHHFVDEGDEATHSDLTNCQSSVDGRANLQAAEAEKRLSQPFQPLISASVSRDAEHCQPRRSIEPPTECRPDTVGESSRTEVICEYRPSEIHAEQMDTNLELQKDETYTESIPPNVVPD